MRVYRSRHLIRPDLQAHINSGALLGNVRNLKSLCKPATKFCAVIKANAYGHGISETVNILQNADVDFFAVASIYEAIDIAELTAEQSILILEPVNVASGVDQISLCAKNGWHCVIASVEALDFVAASLSGSDLVLDLHVNVESGMGRCGIDPEQANLLIEKIQGCSNTRLSGIYTHLATADEEDLSYAWEQLDTFNAFLATNDLAGREDIIIHAANSAATIKMPESHFDMVRCGISMYGYYSRRMKSPPIALTPVMKLQAPIVQLKTIGAGHSVSYGRSFTAGRKTRLAVVPLGYADGYFRSLSNRAKMKVGSCVANVVGRVCMDQLLIDVTDVADAAIGQMVTIIDDDHDSPCGVYAISSLADTICYEILTCVHAHVNRIVH